MKKSIFALVLFASLAGLADGASAPSSPSAPLVTTLLSDGSTNTWSQADLVAALQLMNRKYHRDVETPAGRRQWHGALVMQTIDTNRLVKIERYADGTEFEFTFEQPKPKTPRPANAGVPPALAAARARRAAEAATTNTVTVVTTPDL